MAFLCLALCEQSMDATQKTARLIDSDVTIATNVESFEELNRPLRARHGSRFRRGSGSPQIYLLNIAVNREPSPAQFPQRLEKIQHEDLIPPIPRKFNIYGTAYDDDVGAGNRGVFLEVG